MCRLLIALICFIFSINNFSYSQVPHDPNVSKIVSRNNGNVGLSDITKPEPPYFEVQASSAPLLNWALASALSLDESLVVHQGDRHPVLTVGTYADRDRFLIDARFIVPQKTSNGLYVAFYFTKGNVNLKLFELPIFDFQHLREVMTRAAGNNGFIQLSSPTEMLANWYATDFDCNGWEFIGAESLNILFFPFSDVVFLNTDLKLNKIPFKRTKYVRGNNELNTYSIIEQNLAFTGREKKRVRMIEIENRHLGGNVLCIKSAFNTCFRAGNNFSMDRLSYTQREVKKILRLSVGSLPTQFNAPLLVNNGAMILPPVEGHSHQDILPPIKKRLTAALISNPEVSKIAMPVILAGRWVAFVLDLTGANSLTYLDSSRTLDIDLFDNLLTSVLHIIGRKNLENSCVKIYHVAQEQALDASAPLIIESILRELEVGGPPMPFVLCDRDLHDLRDSHLQLLRFFQSRPEMHSPREGDIDFVGSLPKITHLIPSLLSHFEN